MLSVKFGGGLLPLNRGPKSAYYPSNLFRLRKDSFEVLIIQITNVSCYIEL